MNSKINTISYIEAFERLDKICGYEFNKKFSISIIKLNNFRNQITHATISVDEEDFKQLFKDFIDDLDILFFRIIGEEYKTLSGYDDLVKNHKRYLDLLDKACLDEKSCKFF